MTRRRKAIFALIAVGLSFVLSAGAMLIADLYSHRKFQESGALNIWGYRGRTVGRKQPGEQRIVVLGGSTAFGYGVRWEQAFPAQLERLLNQPQGATPFHVSVVNLAYNNEGAHSLRYTLADYAYLDYDVALFYNGYNDLSYLNNYQVANLQVFRHTSAMFRWTGYFPMLPIVMREKAMMIRYDGHLEDAYHGGATVFRPSVARRSTASVLEAAARLSESLDRDMAEPQDSPNDVRDGKVVLADTEAIACGQFTGYCGELYLAVKVVLDRGKRVLIVTQPDLSEAHQEQQRVMVEYLGNRFAGQTRLRFIDLGHSVNLHDPAVAFDGMHLTAEGNLMIARDMTETVRDSLRTGSATPSASASFAPPATPPPAMSSADVTAVDHAKRSWVSPSLGKVRTSAVDGRPMAWIPPGTFRMGSPASEPNHHADETLHHVTIASGFWMDTNAVTNAAYRRFVLEQTAWSISRLRSTTYYGNYLRDWRDDDPPAGKSDHPVTAVTWSAASAYCTWAGKRLPTEAEWEYAARAGTTTAYWWGDAFDDTRANRNGRGTEPVGRTQRVNPWGLADMAGNVWEWTSSWYQPYPYRADDGREDPGSAGYGRRVLRGGAWVIDPQHLRSADRYKYDPRVASDYVGFRCVRSGD